MTVFLDARRASRSSPAPTSRQPRHGHAGVPPGAARRSPRPGARPARRGRRTVGRGRRRRTCGLGRSRAGRRRTALDRGAARRRGRAPWPATFDAADGGFGGAPKFPPSMVLEFLLRHARADRRRRARSRMADAHAATRWPAAASTTSSAAASRATRVDARLGGPALREDALRQRAAARRLRRAGGGRPATRWRERVARETADFLLASCAPPRAGSPRRWTPTARARRARSTSGRPRSWSRCSGTTTAPGPPRCFGVTEAGTFEHGALDAPAARRPGRRGPVRRRCAAGCSRPGRAGCGRPATTRWSRPGTGWRSPRWPRPGCPAGRAPGTSTRRSTRRAAARRRAPGRPDALRRVSRDGVVGRPRGVLEDYACVADGVLALLSRRPATRPGCDRAERLLDVALPGFAAGDGGFYDTADDAEALVARPRDPSDNASPSGQSALRARAARLRRADRLGPAPRRRRGGACVSVRTASPSASRGSRAGRWPRLRRAGRAASRWRSWGSRGDPGRDEPLRRSGGLGARRVAGAVSRPRRRREARPPYRCWTGEGLVDGRPAAYVCRGMVCDRPVTTRPTWPGSASRADRA